MFLSYIHLSGADCCREAKTGSGKRIHGHGRVNRRHMPCRAAQVLTSGFYRCRPGSASYGGLRQPCRLCRKNDAGRLCPALIDFFRTLPYRAFFRSFFFLHEKTPEAVFFRQPGRFLIRPRFSPESQIRGILHSQIRRCMWRASGPARSPPLSRPT